MHTFMSKIEAMIDDGRFSTDASLSSLVKVVALHIGVRNYFLDKAHIVRKILYAFRNRTHLLRPVQVGLKDSCFKDSFSLLAKSC